MLKQRDHLFDHDYGRHRLNKFGQVCRRLSSDHWGIIVHELAELLSEGSLDGRSCASVGSYVEAGGGYLRGKPVCLREAYYKRDEVLLDLLFGQLFADFVQGVNRLRL